MEPCTTRPNRSCDICGRSFARSEHLSRHRRTHTKEKPFVCPYCRERFQRADVRASHQKSCSQARLVNSDSIHVDSTSGRRRARVACQNCRKRKARCDAQQPCGSCKAAGLQCQYSTKSTLSPCPGSQSVSISSPDAQRSVSGPDLAMDAAIQAERPADWTTNRVGGTLPISVAPLFDTYADGLFDSIRIGDVDGSQLLIDAGQASDYIDLWEIPMDTQFWFDDAQFLSPVSFPGNVSLNAAIYAMSAPALALSTKMQEWFTGASRPSSPSRDRTRRMWYSALPDPAHYKKEVKDVFLRLFQRHIPHTFPIFAQAASSVHKRPTSYVLAMAAVGGLFCSVPGSAEVARSMYNDARRLLLDAHNIQRPPNAAYATAEDKLVIVKTSFILGLWGLCSGDKRSYEFVEAFYAYLAMSVQDYAESIEALGSADVPHNQIPMLLEALYILDAYRVLIMMRPPFIPWWELESVIEKSTSDTKLLQLLRESKLPFLGPHCYRALERKSSLAVLASNAAQVWTAMYPRQNSYVGEEIIPEAMHLGRAIFAEIRCESWLGTQPTNKPADPSHLVLYHLMNIHLHANITLLQSFAHAAPKSPTRDPECSGLARELTKWRRDRHYNIANWHAEQLLSAAEASVSRQRPALDRGRTAVNEASPSAYESPHMPYAVYFATLVLWCGGVFGEGRLSASELRAPIVRGERLLLLHKIHIAQLLGRALDGIR